MISPQLALISGIALSFAIPEKASLKVHAKSWSSRLLQISIILLGSSLNFHSVIKQGAEGVLITFLSILLVFVIGYLGMKIFKIDHKLGTLITMGTAICGGSAIGALAPVIAAESIHITISMVVVFLLNALAVFIFPLIGNLLSMSQSDFGMWAALAIHDTSSVVAASSIYGNEALSLAATVKLTRALWIIPVTLIFSIMSRSKDKKFGIPWFVAGFLGMSLLFTFSNDLNRFKDIFLIISKSGFALTLFLIGITFDWKKMKTAGLKPLAFGVLLWLIVTSVSLYYVL